MRFAFVCFALTLASAAYAAPTSPSTSTSAHIVEVTFLDNWAGGPLSTPVSVIEPEKVQKGLKRIVEKYGSKYLPHDWKFQITQKFEDVDEKGFRCAMKGFGNDPKGYKYSVLYDEDTEPLMLGFVN